MDRVTADGLLGRAKENNLTSDERLVCLAIIGSSVGEAIEEGSYVKALLSMLGA